MSVVHFARVARPGNGRRLLLRVLRQVCEVTQVNAIGTCSGSRSDGSTPVEPNTQQVATVSLSLSAVSLFVGDSAILSASAKDALGADVAGRSATWTTSNADVASVGLVRSAV